MKSKPSPSAALLRRLYVTERLSISQVSFRIGLHWELTRKLLLGAEVPLRRTRVTLSEAVLRQHYLLDKLSTIEMAKLYGCNPEVVRLRLHRLGVALRDKSDAMQRYPRHPFRGPLVEKSHIYGFRMGDINVYQPPGVSKTVVASMHTTKPLQIELTQRLFQPYGQVTVITQRDGTLRANCYLDMSFAWLLPKPKCVPSWVEQSQASILAFIAGYLDAEGSFGVYSDRACMKLDSYDKHLQWWMARKLRSYGLVVNCTKISDKGDLRADGKLYNQDLWRTYIGDSPSLWKLMTWVGPYMKHEGQRARMQVCWDNLVARDARGTIVLPKLSKRPR